MSKLLSAALGSFVPSESHGAPEALADVEAPLSAAVASRKSRHPPSTKEDSKCTCIRTIAGECARATSFPPNVAELTPVELALNNDKERKEAQLAEKVARKQEKTQKWMRLTEEAALAAQIKDDGIAAPILDCAPVGATSLAATVSMTERLASPPRVDDGKPYPATSLAGATTGR